MEFVGGITSFFTGLPLDWLLLGGIGIGIALDALRSGVGRAIAVSIALPLAFVLYSLTDQALVFSSLGDSLSTVLGAAIFAVLFVLAYLLVRRMGIDYLDGGMGEPIQALMAGAAVIVVIVCIWLEIPVLNELYQSNGQLVSLFSEKFRFWWLIGAYATLVFARG
ncbi:MAG: hypothetical protein WA021_01565 [Minisyncoccia bacterium]